MTTAHTLVPDTLKPLIGPRVGMAILGFLSGLPYVIFTGTITAWFTEYEINTKSIGVFALVALPYAFKFLWSPGISGANAPLIGKIAAIGRLRSWILLCLAVIAPAMLMLPVLDPTKALGLIAALSLLAVFASATQDIAIAGWRIGIAKDQKMLDTLTAIEQFSYRISAFFGAAVALVLAQNFGWTPVWWLIAALFTICFALVFFLPDPARAEKDEHGHPMIRLGGTLRPSQRRAFVLPLIAVWSISLAVVFGFMFYVLAINPEASTRTFTKWGAPVIAVACVFAPVLCAALIRKEAGHQLSVPTHAVSFMDRLYITLLEPFVDLVTRLRWGLLCFVFFVLFYRYVDAVWGSLAYPFYLGAPEVNGGLGYSYAEVAAASKIMGVLMTMTGVALGGALMAVLGKMPSLLIGAILAAATNLLYADLAAGAAFTDGFIALTHIDVLFPPVNWLVNLLSPEEDVVVGNALGRLIIVIGVENLAVGLASVVYVAYLSSVVNKQYAAVQYALLASLSILVATLTKPMLGELADERGFVYVFVLTAILGILGVATTIAEWIRVRGNPVSPSVES